MYAHRAHFLRVDTGRILHSGLLGVPRDLYQLFGVNAKLSFSPPREAAASEPTFPAVLACSG